MAGKQPELDVDEKGAAAFVAWYNSNTKSDVLQVFDRKGYYSVHGEDSLFVEQLFFKGTGARKLLGTPPNQLAGVALNRSLYEQLLRCVLVENADRTVEVLEGSGGAWRVCKRASPGNLVAFDEELYGSTNMLVAPVAMAVTTSMTEGRRTIGVAYMDAAGWRLGATEFDDNEQLSGLDSVIVQIGAKEIIIPQDTASSKTENDKLEAVLSGSGALVTRRPRADFSAADLPSTLDVLLKTSASMQQHAAVLERRVAVCALAAVIKFVDVQADNSNHGRFTLEVHRADQYMRLDAAAQRALHVFPSAADQQQGTSSLLGVLNRTRTAMGGRLLHAWLKQPLTDIEAIGRRHDVVQALVDDAAARDDFRDSRFRGLPDIQRLARKLASRKISLQELCQLYIASNHIPAIVELINGLNGDAGALMAEKYGQPLAEAHADDALVKFEELLEAAVDLDAVPDEYLIDASYDQRLQDIKQARDAAAAAVQREAEAIARDLSLEMDKTIKLEWFKSNLTNTRCMRITQKEEKLLRSTLNSKYIVLETRKDGTKFTSKAMRKCAEDLQEHTRAYAETQRSLVDSVREVASTYVPIWEGVSDIIAELDVLAAFAHVAANSPAAFVRPQMLPMEAGELVLEGSRHPCLELQEGTHVIPNDCVMEQGSSWLHIITGPNMGGKSTYIRQVGACVLLAQIGAFVPAARARIAARDCIFARVGAGDCQRKGVSTFMAEMLETAAILKGATHRSLLLIDELGRGTSTYDGFGLAWALCEHITGVLRAPTLFATHFHDLTRLEGEGGVCNVHMEAAVEEGTGAVTMLYRVAPGGCAQSFGVQIAESAGFPTEVVEAARKKLAELEASGAGAGAGAVQQVGKKRKACGGALLHPGGHEAAMAAIHGFLQSLADIQVDGVPEEKLQLELDSMRQGFLQQAKENESLMHIIQGITA